MKVLIPARTNSTRVPNKNFRPFHGEQSLFDIKAEQLKAAGVNPKDVYVSVEDEAIRPVVERHGFNFLLRDGFLCTPEGERRLTAALVESVPADDDPFLLYVLVPDPFFSEYERFLETWGRVRMKGYDSMTAVRPVTHHVLYADGSPANHDFHGQASQCLKPWYTYSNVATMMNREFVLRTNRCMSDRPWLFNARQSGIEIDTMEDFALAQMMWTQRNPPPQATRIM